MTKFNFCMSTTEWYRRCDRHHHRPQASLRALAVLVDGAVVDRPFKHARQFYADAGMQALAAAARCPPLASKTDGGGRRARTKAASNGRVRFRRSLASRIRAAMTTAMTETTTSLVAMTAAMMDTTSVARRRVASRVVPKVATTTVMTGPEPAARATTASLRVVVKASSHPSTFP